MLKFPTPSTSSSSSAMRRPTNNPLPSAASGTKRPAVSGPGTGPNGPPRRKRRSILKNHPANRMGNLPTPSKNSSNSGSRNRNNVLPTLVVSPKNKNKKSRRSITGISRMGGSVATPSKASLGARVAAGVNRGAIVPMMPVTVENTCSANIRVAVRVRPENEREIQSGARTVIEVIDERMLVFDPKDTNDEFFYHGKLQTRRDVNKRVKKDHKFAFDVVFGPESTNQEVFEKTTKDLVDVLFDGYNCSVFVYGATGAGKTFTMLGSPEVPGLTFQTVLELYQRLEIVKEDIQCEVSVSYLEVYNETVVDLINPGKQLAIREDGNNGVQIPGLSMHRPDGPDDLLKLLHFGNSNRTQHPTDANAESSRSHAVFQVFLKQKSRNDNLSTELKVAKLSMIDLAGSERGTVAMARGALRLREGANINKSLLALGNCITALADGSKYVPFRDSKLTRLLKDSIGGNCKTVMISNVTPSAGQFEDTYNTLKYADRAKRIKIKLKKNTCSTGDFQLGHFTKLVDTLNTEIADLKSKMAALEAENEQLKLQQPVTNTSEDISIREAELLTRLSGEEAKVSHQEVLIKELQSQIAELSSKSRSNPQPDNDNSVFELDAKNLEAADKHRSLIQAHGTAVLTKKKLGLKIIFAQKILERSKLISLKGDGSNEKIERHIALLKKKLRKCEKKEKMVAEETSESKAKMEEIFVQLPPHFRWQVKCLKSDFERLSTENHFDHLTDILAISLEEQNRIDGILYKCLPMVKDKHLLLSSYDSGGAKNEEFMDLVSIVQCTKIQFNEVPGVKSFNKDSPFANAEDDSIGHPRSDKSKRMSTGGLGNLANIVDDLEEKEDEENYSVEIHAEEEQPQTEKDVTNSTFTASETTAVSNNINETFSLEEEQSVNSTFVVEEENETKEEELEDDLSPEASPKLQWRPATPPKKNENPHQEIVDKENILEKLSFPTPKNMLKKSQSVSKFPLKPSNNKIAKFYSPLNNKM